MHKMYARSRGEVGDSTHLPPCYTCKTYVKGVLWCTHFFFNFERKNYSYTRVGIFCLFGGEAMGFPFHPNIVLRRLYRRSCDQCTWVGMWSGLTYVILLFNLFPETQWGGWLEMILVFLLPASAKCLNQLCGCQNITLSAEINVIFI